MKKLATTLAAFAAASIAAHADIIDFVDGTGTNTSVSGDSLIWSTTIDGQALDITISTTDTGFDLLEFPMLATTVSDISLRGGAFDNAIDGDPDNGGGTAEFVLISFSSTVDLGTGGLTVQTNKLGLGQTDVGSYEYSVNGGSTIAGPLVQGPRHKLHNRR